MARGCYLRMTINFLDFQMLPGVTLGSDLFATRGGSFFDKNSASSVWRAGARFIFLAGAPVSESRVFRAIGAPAQSSSAM